MEITLGTDLVARMLAELSGSELKVWMALRAIGERAKCTISRLQAIAKLSRQTVIQAISALSKHGYLEKCGDSTYSCRTGASDAADLSTELQRWMGEPPPPAVTKALVERWRPSWLVDLYRGLFPRYAHSKSRPRRWQWFYKVAENASKPPRAREGEQQSVAEILRDLGGIGGLFDHDRCDARREPQ